MSFVLLVSCLLLITQPTTTMSGSTTAGTNDEATMRRNAAEQAGALNQDPGGADRSKLLADRAKEPIHAGRPEVRTSHPDAQWFAERPIGLFIHWGISSVHGGIDLSWPMIKNMGTGTKVSPREYWALADRFKAENFNAAKWLGAAKDAGFTYAVLTAKHHDGYTLWPTDTSDLGVRTHLPGRDLIQEYVTACRSAGLKVGLYYSGPDWWQDRHVRSFNYRSEGPGGSNSSLPPIPGRKALNIEWKEADLTGPSPELRAQIRAVNRKQLTELLTRYGKIDLLWFDGGTGSDITLEEIRALQPGIVINNRGGLTSSASGKPWPGDYFTFEHNEPLEQPPGWWEQLRIWNTPNWGYTQKSETSIASTSSILAAVARSRAWGGAILINFGPRPDGSMPDTYYRGMSEFADWMKHHSTAIHGASPVPAGVKSNVPITTRGTTWYLHNTTTSKGVINVRPGQAVTAFANARNLATGEPVEFSFQDGELTLRLEPLGTPHQVVAIDVVTVNTAGEQPRAR